MSLVRAFICVYLHTNHAGDSKKRAFIPLSEQGARLYISLQLSEVRERACVTRERAHKSHNLSTKSFVQSSFSASFMAETIS